MSLSLSYTKITLQYSVEFPHSLCGSNLRRPLVITDKQQLQYTLASLSVPPVPPVSPLYVQGHAIGSFNY
jgi:hypothetical protein